MAWFILLLAGLLEIVWAYSMKLSEGFSRPGPTAVTIVAMIASFGLLSMAMRTLPLGTAYTVWTGIGALGAFVLGIVLLGEQAGAGRIFAAVLIVTGLVVMKLSTPSA
ncbi:DMT family transporter [Sphingomonas colocasiae]|uniref:Guanidinium exporter n=1 Tax=Sphingomonas colocasiae TaxID=1848973 RepID=A0ABS7PJP9_9SPHN|nr:multidrug efflux SMR transporter [Sphingomonas colocasiae]MBY8821516.1 multidrug efflux SMR transporter [Sphingomonas colocasiae]